MANQQTHDIDLQLESYKLLVDLMKHEELLFWRRNEVFLVINGGLIAILGFIRSTQPVGVPVAVRTISLTICIIGLILSFLWLIIVKRGEAFYNHWYEQLKVVERDYLTPVTIFQRAEKYFATGQIELGGQTFKLDFISRQLHIFHAILAATILFQIIWLVLLSFLYFSTSQP